MINEQTRVIEGVFDEMWLPLLMSNLWIFLSPKVDKLTVMCNELSSPQTLIILKKVS